MKLTHSSISHASPVIEPYNTIGSSVYSNNLQITNSVSAIGFAPRLISSGFTFAKDTILNMSYSGSYYVAVGISGNVPPTSGALIKMSIDGNRWKWIGTPQTTNYDSLVSRQTDGVVAELPTFNVLNAALAFNNGEVLIGGKGAGKYAKNFAILTNALDVLSSAAAAKWIFPTLPFTSEITTFAIGISSESSVVPYAKIDNTKLQFSSIIPLGTRFTINKSAITSAGVTSEVGTYQIIENSDFLLYSENSGNSWNNLNVSRRYLNSSIATGWNDEIFIYKENKLYGPFNFPLNGTNQFNKSSWTWPSWANASNYTITTVAVANDWVFGGLNTGDLFIGYKYYSDWNLNYSYSPRVPIREISTSQDGLIAASITDTGLTFTTNAFQDIAGSNFKELGTLWVAKSPLGSWSSIAVTPDGRIQVGLNKNALYMSTDFGHTWKLKTHSSNIEIFGTLNDVAISSDGSKITIPWSSQNVGGIYVSRDYGNTWVNAQSGRGNQRVAMSSDGTIQTVVGTGVNGNDGQVLVSKDSGATWTAANIARSTFFGISMSANGTKQVAVVYGGFIYVSSDSGATWTQKGSSKAWIDVAVAGDGNNMVAAVNGEYLYVSKDGGNNWSVPSVANVFGTFPNSRTRNWKAVSINSTGTKMVAIIDNLFSSQTDNDRLWISTNSGDVWTANNPYRLIDYYKAWSDVAMSSDGSLIALTQTDGYVYISKGEFHYNKTVSQGHLYNHFTNVCVSGNGQYITAIARIANTTYPLGVPAFIETDNTGAAWNTRVMTGIYSIFTEYTQASIAMSYDGLIQLVTLVGQDRRNPQQNNILVYLRTSGTWTRQTAVEGTTNLKNDRVTCAVSRDGTKLYVASSNGIYVSTNSGTSWQAVKPIFFDDTKAYQDTKKLITAPNYQISSAIGPKIIENYWGPTSEFTPNGAALFVPDNNTYVLAFPNAGELADGAVASNTVECWIHPLGFNPLGSIIAKLQNGGYYEWGLTLNSVGELIFVSYSNETNAGRIPLNKWTHIAIVGKTINKTDIFIDGVRVITANYILNGSGDYLAIGGDTNFAGPGGDRSGFAGKQIFNGYISNFRVTQNQALYTGNFIPSTIPLTLTTNGNASGNTVNPIAANVVFLSLQNSATLQDVSLTPKTVQVTVNDAVKVNGVVSSLPPSYGANLNLKSFILKSSTNDFMVSKTINNFVPLVTLDNLSYTTSGLKNWSGLAVSNDGQIAVGITSCVELSNWNSAGTPPKNPQGIHFCRNYNSTSAPLIWFSVFKYDLNWMDVAINTNGFAITAVPKNGKIHGVVGALSWPPRLAEPWFIERNTPIKNWKFVLVSQGYTTNQYGVAYGLYQLAGGAAALYYSSDTGQTWTAAQNVPQTKNFIQGSMSWDGKYQTVIEENGSLWVSSNFGVNWAAAKAIDLTGNLSDIVHEWTTVDMSSAGDVQFAASKNGAAYISRDYGASWSWGAPIPRSLYTLQEGAAAETLPKLAYKQVKVSHNGTLITATRMLTSYISYDKGNSWTQLTDLSATSFGLGEIDIITTSPLVEQATPNSDIKAIITGTQNNKIAYIPITTGNLTPGLTAEVIAVGTIDGKIGMSNDRGRNWYMVPKANNPFESNSPIAAVKEIKYTNLTLRNGAFHAVGGVANSKGIYATASWLNPAIFTQNFNQPIKTQVINTSVDTNAGFFLGADTGIVARTTDSNKITWTQETSNFGVANTSTTAAIRSMEAVRPDVSAYTKIIAVGDQGKITIRQPSGTWNVFSLSANLVPIVNSVVSTTPLSLGGSLSASTPNFANGLKYILKTSSVPTTNGRIDTFKIGGESQVVLEPSIYHQISALAVGIPDGDNQGWGKVTLATTQYPLGTTSVSRIFEITFSGNLNSSSIAFVKITNPSGIVVANAIIQNNQKYTFDSVPFIGQWTITVTHDYGVNTITKNITTVFFPSTVNETFNNFPNNIALANTQYLSCAVGDWNYEVNTSTAGEETSYNYFPFIDVSSLEKYRQNPKIRYGLNNFYITGLSAGPMLISNKLANKFSFSVKGNSHNPDIYSSDGDIVSIPVIATPSNNFPLTRFNSNIYNFNGEKYRFMPSVTLAGTPYNWNRCSMSKDGKVVVVTGTLSTSLNGDFYQYSLDGGLNWSATFFPATLSTIPDVAVSGDGNTIYIIFSQPEGEGLIVSKDRGATWKKVTYALGNKTLEWNKISTSSNGSVVLIVSKNNPAAPNSLKTFYFSRNGGTTFARWGGNDSFNSCAVSENGKYMAVGYATKKILYTDNNWITSSEKQITTAETPLNSTVVNDNRIIIVVGESLISYTKDFGTNWFNLPSSKNWQSVAMSPNGSHTIVVGNNGEVLTSRTADLNFWASSSTLWSQASAGATQYSFGQETVPTNHTTTVLESLLWDSSTFRGVLESNSINWSQINIDNTGRRIFVIGKYAGLTNPIYDIENRAIENSVAYISLPLTQKVGEKLLKLQGNGLKPESNSISHDGVMWHSINSQLNGIPSTVSNNRSSAAYTNNKLLIVGSSEYYEYTNITNTTNNFEITGIPSSANIEYGLTPYIPAGINSVESSLTPQHGIKTEDWYGKTVEISEDGATLITGFPKNIDLPSRKIITEQGILSNTIDYLSAGTGKVNIYQKNFATNGWDSIGTLYGILENSRFGYSVSVNADSQVVAIGAPGRFGTVLDKTAANASLYTSAVVDAMPVGLAPQYGKQIGNGNRIRNSCPFMSNIGNSGTYPFAQFSSVVMSSAGDIILTAAEHNSIWSLSGYPLHSYQEWRNFDFISDYGFWTDMYMTKSGNYAVACCGRNNYYEILGAEYTAVFVSSPVNRTSWSGCLNGSTFANRTKIHWTGCAISDDGNFITVVAARKVNPYDSSTNNGLIVCLSATSIAQTTLGTDQGSSPNGMSMKVTKRFDDAVSLFTDVAMNSSGQFQLASRSNGTLLRSINFGVTWTATGTNLAYKTVYVSPKGDFQLAGVTGGQIYVSTNYGVDWNARGVSKRWTAFDMTLDGSVIVAAAESAATYTAFGGLVPGYTDSTTIYPDQTNLPANSITNNEHIRGAFGTMDNTGGLHYSYDRGLTWTPAISGTSQAMWSSVAITANGSKVVGSRRVPYAAYVASRPTSLPSLQPWDLSTTRSGVTTYDGGPIQNDVLAGTESPGYVQVHSYSLTDGTWSQKGQTMYGEFPGENFGSSVSLSNDGNVLLVGAPFAPKIINSVLQWKTGSAKVYKYDNTTNTWLLTGSKFEGEVQQARLGTAVSTNNQGNVIAIGSIGSDVKVYSWVPATTTPFGAWALRGTKITGTKGTPTGVAGYGSFGATLQLNGAGDRIVIGAPTAVAINSESGTAQVLQWNSPTANVWNFVYEMSGVTATAFGTQATLAGISTANRITLGASVDINKSGDVIIAGAPCAGNLTTLPGFVQYANTNDKIIKRIDGSSPNTSTGYNVAVDGNVNNIIYSSKIPDPTNIFGALLGPTTQDPKKAGTFGTTSAYNFSVSLPVKSLWTTKRHTNATTSLIANYSTSTQNAPRCIAASPTDFLVGTIGGRLVYSTDAETWTSVTIQNYEQNATITLPHVTFNSIAYGGGYFCAVGTHGTILVSNNETRGDTLTLVSGGSVTLSAQGHTFTEVIYNNLTNRFVVTGTNDLVTIQAKKDTARSSSNGNNYSYTSVPGTPLSFMREVYNISPDNPISIATDGSTVVGLGRYGEITKINLF